MFETATYITIHSRICGDYETNSSEFMENSRINV